MFAEKVRRYLAAQCGNVSIIFAITSIPLLIAAGTAIDYIRYNQARTDIQAALDGAALAAALPETGTDEERVAVAKEYFSNNLKAYGDTLPELQVAVNEVTVEARVVTRMNTAFMHLAGIDIMDINEFSEVVRPFKGLAEVALVLDYSGSMNSKGKYQSMANAATEMIDNLDASIEDGKLKMGIVPFSAMVYTSMDKDFVSQASAAATWTGCTQDRHFSHNTNVDTPSADPQSKWGYFDNTSENKGTYACTGYQSRNLKIVPLTTNLADLKSRLSSMTPLGNTNIALGAEFGWNLLDPQEPFDEGEPYTNQKNRKFLILLTDGVQTSKHFGPGQLRSVTNGEQNLLTLCDNMRDAGVTVFSIAYDVTDPKVTTLLSDCAPGRYFQPDAGQGSISTVFNEISSNIKNQIARLKK